MLNGIRQRIEAISKPHLLPSMYVLCLSSKAIPRAGLVSDKRLLIDRQTHPPKSPGRQARTADGVWEVGAFSQPQSKISPMNEQCGVRGTIADPISRG